MMKKILLGIIVFAFVAQASAQKFGGGLEGGFVYSWLSTDSKEASVESGRFSFTYGAFLDMNLSDNFSFTTGLNMNYVGGTIKYDNAISLNWDDRDYAVEKDAEVTYKVQYLEIPISLKGKTKEIGYITYFGRLGASPMLGLKSRADVNGNVIDKVENGTITYVSDKEDLNIKENINMFNIGWHVGGGFEYSLGGSTSVIVELMYAQNFLSMTKDNITGNNKDINVTNSMVVLKAGIKF